MGWFYTHESRDALIQSLVRTEENERVRITTVRHTVFGDVMWAVVGVTAKQDIISLDAGESGLFIQCYLLRQAGRMWGYKALSESDGPCYYTCPLSYLKLVPALCTPWREKVLAWHRSRENRV